MCVLRAIGTEFDVDQFLSGTSLEPCAVWRRGEENRFLPQTRGQIDRNSGVNVAISDGPWNDRAAQIADVESFFANNAAEIRRLRSWPGVEEVIVDIPIELRIGEKVAVQAERFPPEFIQMLADFGLTLAISIWPPASDDTDEADATEKPTE